MYYRSDCSVVIRLLTCAEKKKKKGSGGTAFTVYICVLMDLCVNSI